MSEYQDSDPDFKTEAWWELTANKSHEKYTQQHGISKDYIFAVYKIHTHTISAETYEHILQWMFMAIFLLNRHATLNHTDSSL